MGSYFRLISGWKQLIIVKGHLVNIFTRLPLPVEDSMPESPLKKEFDYYIAHQDEFVRDYNGRVIVLKNCELIGVFDDAVTAIQQTQKDHALGTFLVQKVEPGTGAYTQVFHTRVA
jgi:hypothetical protein